MSTDVSEVYQDDKSSGAEVPHMEASPGGEKEEVRYPWHSCHKGHAPLESHESAKCIKCPACSGCSLAAGVTTHT